MHCFCTCYLPTQPVCGRYLSTWFAFDVCSTFPFQSISLLFDEHEHSLGLKFLNVLRLWRLRRVSSLFARYVRRVFFFLKKASTPVKLKLTVSATNDDAIGSRRTSGSTTQ
jgi:hypothetical protein